MSTKALWDQATHTLTVIGQQEPTVDDIKILHSGYLAAIMQRIKLGNMMSLGEFRKSIGLGILERLPLEISVPALAEPFDPKDRFTVDISDSASIKISHRGDNFKSWMLSSAVSARPSYGLEVHSLTRHANDEEILHGIAREDIDTDTAAIHHLVAQQPNGPESRTGPLLTDGCSHIFYVFQQIEKDKRVRPVRRVVGVFWRGGGWRFSASAVPDPSGWCAGCRVFLRKHLDTVSV